MRLIQCRTLQLEQFSRPCPPYAVVSHTWGDEEVGYHDFRELQKCREKRGWLKIEAACKEATKLGLDYVWIDTACIDKSSSAELQEAVNSMWRWFYDATVCLVYLDDVDADSVSSTDLRHARWFKRGWTLMELLAPARCQFFNRQWDLIGEKSDNRLCDTISSVTGIPGEYLRDRDLVHKKATIAERIKWAENRETTRIEDKAYCLLGLLDVNMPLLYGEQEKAFSRLKLELERSHEDAAKVAAFDERVRLADIESTVMPNVDDEGSVTTDHEPEDIFSAGGSTTSSMSSVNPVATSAIRVITQVLLGDDSLKHIYDVAIQKTDQRKFRRHVRGFLGQYAGHLERESTSHREFQASKFLGRYLGRIADEIRWAIAGFEEYSRQQAESSDRAFLGKYLSDTTPRGVPPNPRKTEEVEDTAEDDEPEPPLQDVQLSATIEELEHFLLEGPPFRSLLQQMQSWLGLRDDDLPGDPSPEKGVREQAHDTREEHIGESTETDDSDKEDSDEPTLEDTGALPTPLVTGEGVGEPDQHDVETSQVLIDHAIPDTASTEANTAGWRSETLQAVARPLKYYLYDLLELFRSPAPRGYRRLRWKCTCGEKLMADFKDEDDDALNNLLVRLRSPLDHRSTTKAAVSFASRETPSTRPHGSSSQPGSSLGSGLPLYSTQQTLPTRPNPTLTPYTYQSLFDVDFTSNPRASLKL
ncbi:HET domain-containing [Fusarium albosuccineum]|uniref:HET domain-containing n=1 Tax=Fusarium albosuccineum TaxID=1237068 RepID=A0A8H4KYI0_9HYPO|nr:HET domain-containing [Fusarium albosuccineum]